MLQANSETSSELAHRAHSYKTSSGAFAGHLRISNDPGSLGTDPPNKVSPTQVYTFYVKTS